MSIHRNSGDHNDPVARKVLKRMEEPVAIVFICLEHGNREMTARGARLFHPECPIVGDQDKFEQLVIEGASA